MKLNWVEAISIRGGFTFYSAWLLVATILNITFWLKASGSKINLAWSIATLYIVCCTYFTISLRLKNPLFSLVYFWVLSGIANNAKARRLSVADEATFTKYLDICFYVHGVLFTIVLVYSIRGKMNGSHSSGLLY